MNQELKDTIFFPWKFVGGAILLTALVIVWMGWVILNSSRFAELTKTQFLPLEQLHGKILQYDEVLTMSARMAAATGKKLWIDRNRHHELLLDRAIKDAINISQSSQMVEAAQETDVANARLVRMEYQSFELIEAGRSEEAQVLLSSDAYNQQKVFYARGMNNLLLLLQDIINERTSDQQNQNTLSIGFVLFLLCITSITWIVVFRSVKQWRNTILVSIAERSEAESALSRARDELELKVYERTNELSESEERLTSILNNIPASVSLKDAEGRYLHVNTEYAANSPATAKAMLGKTVHEINAMSREDADRFDALDRDVVKTGRVFIKEWERLNAEGDICTRRMTKFPIVNSAGEVTGIGGISTDITEQKQQEAVLREAHKISALGEVTGGVAHEFNNMLQVMTINLQLTANGLATLHGAEDQAKRVQVAIDTAFRGAKLTDQLLSYTGKQLVRPQVLEVEGFIAGSVEMLSPMLGETVEIGTEIGEDLRPINVDRGQLEAALLNLAVNARDAMNGAGKVVIEVENVYLDDSFIDVKTGPYVVVAVRDNGTGMTPEVIAQAFDPFFTTKDVGQGTGLGLSMVYGFVARQSDGHVEIESEEGAGTTVRLYFPAHETEEKVAFELSEKAAHADVSEITVLVVEDDADLLEATLAMIMEMGYRVQGARDAAEALAVLDQIEHLDILLTDIVMPGGVHGDLLANTVRTVSPDTKVLLMSGYPDDELAAKGIKADRAETLRKPFKEYELMKALELPHRVRKGLGETT